MAASLPNSPTGGELFIVDNSETHWKGLRYLQEWTEIASAFDVATGYFEIGALLALDGQWQKLDRIRILMGDEVTARTRQAILDGLRRHIVQKLDASLESEKETNDFLRGVAAIVEGMRSGKIECRVYSKRKFHAKTYITHPRISVIGSVALVGSSNFTLPGLTQNIELNIQIRASGDVAQLQAWFEHHWEEAEPITEDVLRVIERHTYEYSPFEVYIRALQELLRTHQITSSEWEKESSVMFRRLDEYQRNGYAQLLDKGRTYGGTLLCDGVGLGKTFVGLMLIERLISFERKRVVLIVPKSGRGPVWETALRANLPKLSSQDFSNLAILNHTDLVRGNEFPERIAQLTEKADAVIVDEAHHFRNLGRPGVSRYWKLRELCTQKTLFLLTATPINNSLIDLQHLIELFTRRSDHFREAPLGIHSLSGHFRKMERDLAREISADGHLGKNVLPESVETNEVEAGQFLQADSLCRALVVQRSRAYVKRSQEKEAESSSANALLFPHRDPPTVVEYSIKKTYGHLLELVEKAFAKKTPLFSLAIYYPLAYPVKAAEEGEVDPFDKGRQEQIVRLIRILFLKRFESSARAFEFSCEQLLRKLLAWVTKHSTTPTEQKKLEKWKILHADVLDYAHELQLDLFGTAGGPDGQSDDAEEDLVSPEMLESVEELPRDKYRVADILDETYLDLDTLIQFLAELKKFKPVHDDKLKALVKLLKSERLRGRKVLLFTEYAATARYLRKQLEDAGLDGLDEVDSMVKRDRGDIIRQFAPYYNGTTTAGLNASGLSETRVLISTDVLSEGLNLQDATFLINYDLHWNPVRLMQRIGRVDRRLNADTEKRIVADHPATAKLRGQVAYWNFLPPDELDGLLKLYKRVSEKTLRISKVFGIEGKKLLKPDDDYADLRDFDSAYEGQPTVEESLRLELQGYLQAYPGLTERIPSLPGRLFSGKRHPMPGTRAVFFCYSLPAPVLVAGVPQNTGSGEPEWSEAAGDSRWFYYRLAEGDILETPADIHAAIQCEPTTPRHCVEKAESLREIRLKVEKHIKQTYLKQTSAPIGVRPALKCWMELN